MNCIQSQFHADFSKIHANFSKIFNFQVDIPLLNFEFLFLTFRKLRGRKFFKTSFYSSVFDTEKHGHKDFAKFQLFGFLGIKSEMNH